ncbi:MAG: septum formation initiator family protein [Bacteroidota bacterium]
METLKKIFSNFYIVLGTIFLLWLIFFDSNDLYTQIKQKAKLETLEDEKEFYLEKIEEVKEDREELMSNDELLEKFAREKYLMKKPEEDVYVVVDEENDSDEE